MFFAAESQQMNPKQRRPFQREWLIRQLGRNTTNFIAICATDIVELNGHRSLGADHLCGDTVPNRETRAQRFVSRNQQIDCPLQTSEIEFSMQTNRQFYIVDSTAAFQLIQKP
jgi:hypothetical protein